MKPRKASTGSGINARFHGLIPFTSDPFHLSYGGEPPEYLQPVRHTLGAVYLKVGRFAEAEEVFRRDLAEFPGNGWSLYGLQQALAGQHKDEEAEEVGRQIAEAWEQADEPLGSPCKCIRDL